MTSLDVPASVTSSIIDDPTVIFSLVHPDASRNVTTSPAVQANISIAAAEQILHGYNSGVRALFILNASLAALCVVVSALMIKHKELVRADDADRKKAAIQTTGTKSDEVEPGSLEFRDLEDISKTSGPN